MSRHMTSFLWLVVLVEVAQHGISRPDWQPVVAKKFSSKYTHRLLKGGIGHNLPQEAPQAFAETIVDVDRL